MKVLLLEHVDTVGKAGDVVDVTAGFARNFLFPKGLAAKVTARRLQEAAAKRTREEEASRVALEEVERQVHTVDGKSILLRRNVGPTGELFGAVTAREIAAEVETALGVTLPKRVIRLKEPIRQIGEKPVHLEFPHGLEADIVVIVEAEPPTGAHPATRRSSDTSKR